MRQWRRDVIALLRKHKDTLILPAAMKDSTETTADFSNRQYSKHWHVRTSKPEKQHKKIIDYLGRYLKRHLAVSRILFENDEKVVFNYCDHHDGQHKRCVCSPDEFLQRLLQHVPEKGFCMIRYFGFLANWVRGKLLPKVFQLLNQKVGKPKQITFVGLYEQS